MFDALYKELRTLPEIKAIALGGSRAGENYDEKSDYDLYIYVTAVPEEKVRKAILEKYCSYMELGNSYWELEDDCTLKNGIDIDILYRDMNSFLEGVEAVVSGYNAGMGYTTCMWHNLKTCKILYDETNILTEAQKKYTVEYPEQLKQNVVDKNILLLHGILPSYDKQIKKAARRGDYVAVNHRTAAFFESYFDILFAINNMTHPGEKREVEYIVKYAKKIPDAFESNIDNYFKNLFVDFETAEKYLEMIIMELNKIIREDKI